MHTPTNLLWTAAPRPCTGWTVLGSAAGAHGGADLVCDVALDGIPVPPATFDHVVVDEVVHDLDVVEIMAAMRELRRVLRPGGCLRLRFVDFDRAVHAYLARHAEYLWSWAWESYDGNLLSQLTNHGRTRTLLTPAFALELLAACGFARAAVVGAGKTTCGFAGVVAFDGGRPDASFCEAYRPAPSPPPPGGTRLGPVHLCWTDDPHRSLTVIWRSGDEEPETVRFRAAGDRRPWAHAPPEHEERLTAGFVRRAVLRDLDPGQRYEYRVVGAGTGSRSASWTARTAPLAPEPVTFAFLADTGVGGRPDGRTGAAARVVEQVAAHRPLFVLGGGDYAYADRDPRFADPDDAIDAWFTQMEPLLTGAPFVPQYGNHEVLLGERFADWSARFAPAADAAGGSCSFDVGPCHVTGLFVPAPAALTAARLAWLEHDLAAARRRGATWLVVFQHEPLFAHGASHPADRVVRERLGPVLERYAVDLHLSAHDQSYERTFPLSHVATAPRCTASGGNTYEQGVGVVYAKVSPAGKLSDETGWFSHLRSPAPPLVAVRDDGHHHYAVVECGAAELSVTVHGVPADGTATVEVDRFCIVRR